METNTNLSDAFKLFDRLTPEEIEQRLIELEAEARSLKTILRSLRARESAKKRRASK